MAEEAKKTKEAKDTKEAKAATDTKETKAAKTGKVSAKVKKLVDEIVGLTLMQAKELSDYLKEEYGIEPAAG